MASFSRALKSLARWALVSRRGDDSGRYPVQQVTYLGKVGDALMWLPYGLHANVPEGDLVLLFSLQGKGEARVGIPGSPKARPPLAPGEVALHHPVTGTKIHLKADGSVEIDAIGNVTVNAAGDASVVAGGTALVDGAVVELGGTGGPAVARVGDSVAGGVIVTGSGKVNAV